MKKFYSLGLLFSFWLVAFALTAQVIHLPDYKSWNTLYFQQGESFTFSVNSGNTKVKVNGSDIYLDQNFCFNAALLSGVNTIAAINYVFVHPTFPGNTNTQTASYEVKAAQFTYSFNKPDGIYAPGDEVIVTFEGLTLPLAASDAVQPQSAKLTYATNIDGIATAEGANGVTDPANLNSLRFTLPANTPGGAYKLTSGQIKESWIGSPLYTGQTSEAGIYTYAFDRLPELGIQVEATPDNDTPFGYDSNEVAEDWKNDLWLNADFKELTVGDTYQIVARRVPEIIDNPISNTVSLPPFRYTLVRGNSVSINENGLITAKAAGTSIIEVTYGEKTVNNQTYAACSPVNVTYMIVDVTTEASTLDIQTTLNARSYDTFYFTGDHHAYTFNVTAAGATDINVKCNDVEATRNGDAFTVLLKNRANVIEIVATNETSTRKLYKVVDARKIEVVVNNTTHPGESFTVGDVAQVSFKGIVPPLYKLATFYNPMYGSIWGGEYTRVIYENAQLGTVRTNINVTQYDLADKNTIEFKLAKAGNYNFTNGHINAHWWGSDLNDEKNYDGPGRPNLSAVEHQDNFSVFPTFNIAVAPAKPELPADAIVLDLTTPTVPESFVFLPEGHWSETYNDKDYPYIESQVFAFSHLLSGNSWGGYAWEGFTVSQSTDNATDHEDFPTRQWGCMAQGGVDGIGTSYILGFNSEYMGAESNQVIFNDGNTYNVQGTFVNNTAYTTRCITHGHFVARQFAKGDSLVLRAHGLNADYEDNGKSVSFYLADYRSENESEWTLNDSWEWFDMRALGEVSGIYFTIHSSDNGSFGNNTANYFALDKLAVSAANTTGVESVADAAQSLAAYPNPFADQLTVTCTEAGTLQLFTLQGKMVMNVPVHAGENQLNTAHLPSGVYVVKCGDAVIRLIK